MNKKDIYLQESIQAGKEIIPDNENELQEILTYQKLFDALNTPIPNRLPNNFSTLIVNKIQAKRERKWHLGLNILIGFLLTFTGIFLSTVLNKEIIFQVLKIVYGKVAIVLFVILCVLVIQLLDNKLKQTLA